jgi:hypothetical protein
MPDEGLPPDRHTMPCAECNPLATYAMVAPIIAEVWPELAGRTAPPGLTVEVVLTVPKALGCPKCEAVRWHADTNPEVFGLVLTCLECGNQTNTNELLEMAREAGRLPAPSPTEGAGSEEGASPGGG